jgi:U3 small nucleolar RNA-associated protein 22
MAPATKRRKLEHEDESSASDVNSGEDIANGAISSDDDERDAGDVSMDGLEDANGDGVLTDGSLEEDDEEETEEEEAIPATKEHQKAAAKPKGAEKPKSRSHSDTQLQDGAYTSETFKSNVFKLQVDELLDQVKLKYGKKEAPAENVMRTLKAIIEQLPSREAQLVCYQ